MREYATALTEAGHEVTARWILGDHDIRAHGESEAAHWMPAWAQEDWNDLMGSDVLVSFTEGPVDVPGRSRGGRHVEYGAAMAAGLRLIVVGYRENVFHWMPETEFYPTWLDALTALSGVQP